MTREQFDAILPIICADVIGFISKQHGIEEMSAMKLFYGSKLYETLEREETKLWQYSTPMLYSLFEEELSSGIINYPDV